MFSSAAFSPNMAESVKEDAHLFAAWLSRTLLYEVNDNLAEYYKRFMEEFHDDELKEIREKDEAFFETLMFPACAKCKEVDSYTGFHGVCVRGRRLQCTSSLGADEWVNSDRYKEILERIEKR